MEKGSGCKPGAICFVSSNLTLPIQMSTSNIKSPIVIRQGYVLPWRSENILLESTNSFLRWELEKINTTLVSCVEKDNILIICYYKWFQVRYSSKVLQKFRSELKNKVEVFKQFGSADSKFLKIRLRASKVFKKTFLIENFINSQRFYQIPVSTQIILMRYIWEKGNTKLTEVRFVNIFKQAGYVGRLINVKDLIYETPAIKGNLKSIYHMLDMVVLVDLVSLKICTGKMLGILIGKILERSSRKGLFVKSLRILSKLPRIIGLYEIKRSLVNQERSWNWVVRITGKISGMGRTKSYSVFSKKLPLHTITANIDYSETVVNTKAGTFSIKVWILL